MTLAGDASGEFRVALVAPGTMTHANNFSQRYVELFVFSSQLKPPPAQSTITVNVPLKQVAPPGWYMLTVVSAAGIPSAAEWVRILE